MPDMEPLYQQRLRRYTTAMRGGKPDRVPIRPFVAEFIATYTGCSCQDVTQDYQRAFDATLQCCKDFDWDAAVANMVYVWGGIAQAVGLRYYAIPGVGLSPRTGFQYLEPPEGQAWMQPEEYDDLIRDPTGYLYNVWYPRISADAAAPGQPNTERNNFSLVRGAMAMLSYFGAFPQQIQRMRSEAGTVSAIAGILKAPLDILADKLRGYIGLCTDLVERPEKVKAACEALQPHLLQVADSSGDPTGTVPVGFWMHRSCVPFISYEQFDNIFWPTLKPIITELFKRGKQTLFYAEGNWDAHLKSFAELPDHSIVYHCDRGDIFRIKREIGQKFCLSGGLPNTLLSFGKPQEVRDYVKKLIQGAAQDGGYILDASAIIQNDAQVENVRAMTQAAREFGQY